MTADLFPSSLPYIIDGAGKPMTNAKAAAKSAPTKRARLLFVLLLVSLAAAVPVLPLRFLGIPGPDFPDVAQVVTTSKNWLSKIASRIELRDSRTGAGARVKTSLAAPQSATPADQVRMLSAAADELKADIEKSPCDPGLQNRLGLLYLSLADSDQAREHFQKAISLSRLGIAALSDKINSLKSDGHTSEASSALLEASNLSVELSAAHSNLARLYEKRGEHDKVIAELDMLNREGVLFDSSVAASIGNTMAEPMLEPAVARDLARAEALLQSRQLLAAANEYRKVLAQNPNVAMAHHRLGTILAMSNNAAVAIDELEMAAKLDPASPEIQTDLGWAYQAMALNVQAIKAYEHALALEPRQTDAAINLSNIYCGVGRSHDAFAVLSQALQSNPASAKAHNNLGTLLSLDGKFGPASYEFQKAISLEPRMASAHYGLGVVLMQSRSYIPAIREFKQALALQPNLGEAQLKIDEACRKVGMTVGSAQALN